MKIERARVDGFGRFNGQEFGPFDRGLTVLHGPNEAGKSTMLAFLRTMLFGWPLQKRAEFYPALERGTHGGRLFLAGEDGAAWTLTRTESPRGASLELSGPGGRVPQPEAKLATLLGHASKAVFETVFAFSLDGLQDAKSLDEKDVSSQIYSAGMGAAALPAALKRIEAERAGMFLPGGQMPEISKTLAKIAQAERELQGLGLNADRYAELMQLLAELRRDLDADTCRVAELEKARRRKERMRDAWPDYGVLQAATARIGSLQDYPGFPGDALPRLEKLEDASARARAEFERATEAHALAVQQAQLPEPDERLLTLGEQIERLPQERTNVVKLLEELPRRIQQSDDAAREFSTSLRAVGHGWDATRLEQFDDSEQARGLVDGWQARLEAAAHEGTEALGELQAGARELESARERAARVQLVLDELGEPTMDADAIERRYVGLVTARTRLDEWLRARKAHEQAQEIALSLSEETVTVPATARGQGKGLGTLLVLGGLGLGTAGMLLGGNATLIGAASGVAATATGAWLWWREARRTGPAAVRSSAAVAAESRAEAARQAESECRARLEEVLAEVGALEPAAEQLAAVETRLRAADAAWSKWVQTRQQAAERQQEFVHLRAQQETRESAANLAAQQHTNVLEGWQAWLTARGLDPALSPASTKAVFALAGTARAKAQAVAAAEHRVAAMRADIEEYRARVVAIAGPLEMPVPIDDRELAGFADKLVSGHRDSQEAARRLAAARDTEAQAAAAVARRLGEAEAAESAVAAFVRLGGTHDREEFRRRARVCAERCVEQEKQQAALERLQTQAGTAEAAERLIHALTTTDLDTLEEELALAEQQLAELAERKAARLLECGRLEQESRTLSSNERASVLRAERVELTQELRDQARRWAVATAALTVLRQAQAKFERERQPGVIRHAQAFFQEVTGGRYTEVQATLGKQQVSVREPDGTWKTPAQLSRGTQEQLYLALRFGLIRQFNDQETALPVVVDDILVNFDPGRAARTVRALGELSKTNQVLVFTCHPHVRELFQRELPGTQVIELGQGC